MVKAQMKIQQMIFMILAVFLFFILVGLFVLNVQMRGLKGSSESLKEAEAINSLTAITSMTELSCASSESTLDSFCLDGDKIEIMSKKKGYSELWPIASLEVYKISPSFTTVVKCPAVNCNYYSVFDNGQNQTQKVSTYVNICYSRMKDSNKYDSCEIAKILVGVKN
jgi:hypothetical protein